MPDPIRWGILSTAHINRRVIPVIQEHPYSVVTAVASRNPQKAKQYAAEWKIPKAFGSYKEMIEDPEIDVIYISLPNHLHADWIVRCLEAGKHVLCEKPLCLDMDELNRIDAARNATGRQVVEALMYLYHPQTAMWKSLIDEGRIGTLTQLNSSFCFRFTRGADNYRLAEPRGGGALWDVGIYPVSLFQYLTGKVPIGVNGRYDKRGDVDISFWATLEYPGNITAEFFVSFDAEFTTLTRLEGTAGNIEITHPFVHPHEGRSTIRTRDGVTQLDTPSDELYFGEVDNLNQIVRSGSEAGVTLDQSRAHLRTILALYESAERGAPVIL